MPNCPECESPITVNDQFCPVCGFALPQSAAAAPQESQPAPTVEAPEEEFDGTLMMSPDELAALANLKKPAASSDDNIPKTLPEIETGLDKTAEQINAVVDDPPAFVVESPPSPAILDQANDTSGNIDVPPTGQYRVDQEKTVESIDNVEEMFEPGDTPVIEVSEAAVSIYEEKASEPATFEVEAPSVEQEESEPDTLLTPEFPPTPAAFEPPVPENIISEPTNVEPRFEPAPLFDDEPVPEIAKPEFDLPEYQQDNPIYDSVRIVAPEPPVDEEFVATQIPVSRDLAKADPKSEIPAEERSPTTPNFDAGTSDGRKSAKLKPLTEGAILNNRYEIIRKIGGGGMGAVYLASDNNLGGVLRAVKEMVQAHIEEDQQEKAINDFKRESMILSSLDHPAIPTIFDYFYDQSEGRFYLVMKYISGGDLAARLKSAPEGKIDEATVVDWALQIIDVLNYLHNQPSTIVYRDLKPSNIMIDGNSGRVMLIDFGIARSISQKEEKGVTAVGTMGYAPPELFSGNVEPRSDIYSLGSTMFHLLTGADPQSNPLLIFDFQKNPRPRQINPRLSDQIERVLMRSVEYSADSRFASAAEMRQVLEAHLINLKAGNVTYGVGEIPASVALADQSVFCGFCGQGIVATDMFCAFCGSRQPIAQQGVHHVAAPRAAAATARLMIEGTSELSMPAFALQKEENLLGRRDPMSNIFPEVDLSKYDPQTKISRRHARIWKQGDSFLVEDLGSSNGTILTALGSGQLRLTPHKPQLLTNGDRIKLGDTTLHFVVD